MIPQKPIRFKCPKCGFTKIVKPKSDVLNPMDMISTCPKCKSKMIKEDLNVLDELLGSIYD